MMKNTGACFPEEECKFDAALDLAGKEVGDKDRAGRDSLGTLLVLVVVVVLPTSTSVLCRYIVDSGIDCNGVIVILAERCIGSQK